ncbi:DUF365 domain-containing protein [Methanomethylovorans sp.]|uniref:DUF365 domain-containing protein n=1 Tax=Methanomethylovorans sp. TaxID=2758717 RepID=UPI00028BB6D4|nr:hypothetical protein Mpsy_0151 [Methanolobus psychrophilus R15]
MDSIIGVVYPLHKDVIDYMFSNKKDVFVKYTSRQPQKKSSIKIKEGMKLYFYESGGSKSIIGETTILKYDYLDMQSVLDKYLERLIVSEEDFRTYAKGREQKKALVLEFGSLKKYKEPVKLLKPITMAGLHLTEERKKELFAQDY